METGPVRNKICTDQRTEFGGTKKCIRQDLKNVRTISHDGCHTDTVEPGVVAALRQWVHKKETITEFTATGMILYSGWRDIL